MLNSKTIQLGRVWIKLPNTEQGVLIQTSAGETVYYVYSLPAPKPDDLGFPEDAVGGPSRLRGGDIWVRSKNWSVLAYAPFNVDGTTLEALVGDLADLPTTDKSSVVNAIIELNDNKADLDMVGDLGQLHTDDQSSVINAVNELHDTKVDTTSIGDVNIDLVGIYTGGLL